MVRPDPTVTAESSTGTTTACGTAALFGGRPGFTGALLDVASHQASHDLRGRRILLRAQPLEQLLLAWIDQDGESGSAIFDGQCSLT